MQGASILIVDDEEHLQKTLALNLKLEQYQTTCASTLKEARSVLEQESIDLIILDLTLPDGDGFDLCKELRQNGMHQPIIMLTARHFAEDRIFGLEVGADDYICKPFDLNELLARISSQLRRAKWNKQQISPPESSSASTRAKIGNVVIDFNQHQLIINEQTAHITTLELQLIRYFLDNPDRVISRQELLAEVWKMPNYPNTRTVDNFIMRLRKIFEQDSSSPKYFRSIRGRGYLFSFQKDNSTKNSSSQ